MKLIRMIQWAHAIEVGAYHAYEGHWRSIKPIDSPIRGKVKWIQVDELVHKEELERILTSLNAKPDKFQDALLWFIGKTISLGCYVMGYRMSMWGAKVMEVMGSNIYLNLAVESINSGHKELQAKFCEMAMQEEEHEKFFNSMLIKA